MKKKKILFVMTSLHTGGIATSISNLLCQIGSRTEYEIDLLLFDDSLNECEDIHDNVNIINAGNIVKLIAISQKEAKKMGIAYYAFRLLVGGIAKFFGHGYAYKIMFMHVPRLKEYDIAISCTQSGPLHSLYGGCNEFVLNRIKAKLKVAFIHCDYITYGINDKYSHNIYKHFDRIAAVSNSVKKVFLNEEPLFAKKTYTVYNCQNITRIATHSQKKPYIYDETYINFITVARMGSEKGHIRMLPILSRLKAEGHFLKWHIVGSDREGAPEEFVTGMVEYGLEDTIVFHGRQNNPYRFMVHANFLLVPSMHEAAPMVFGEACQLKLPILATNTVSAIELVQDHGIGIVCDNNDLAIERSIRDIIENPSVLQEFKKKESEVIISNREAIEQFEKIIDPNI